MQLLTKNGIDKSFIRFSGLDGTNVMSEEHKDLQKLICHSSPHSLYLNCRNHRSALFRLSNSKILKAFRVRCPPNFFVENLQI